MGKRNLARTSPSLSGKCTGVSIRLLEFLLVALTLSFVVGACTSTPPLTEEEKQRESKELEAFFVKVRVAIRDREAETVYHSLSRDSKNWFKEMRNAADSEPLNFLRNRPFFEILCVLTLRVQERLNPFMDRDPVSLIKKVVIEAAPVNHSITKHSLGPFRVYSGGRGDVGLQKAENTPVFFFEKENTEWKLNLVQSLPLILLGLENLARQKKEEPLSQAMYVLEELLKQKLEPEDLRL